MATMQISDRLASDLEELAIAAGQERDIYIREILIEHMEDVEDIRIVTERLRKPRPSISLEEVTRRLGLNE